jgi:hypothetical protein
MKAACPRAPRGIPFGPMKRALSTRRPTLEVAAIGGCAFGAWFLVGCAVEPSSYASDADVGTTQALVSIERTLQAGSPDEGRAEAFAGFLKAPPEADASAVLRLTGLSRYLPAEGSCTSVRDREASIPLAPLTNVELVDAGNLAVEAGGVTTTLAPRAFPTVTDLVSGVVYTSRDRTADQLPPERSYRVTASGGFVAPFTAQAEAPSELSGVFVNHAPIEELGILSARSAIELAWQPGEARDVVYVDVSTDGGQPALLCAFRDDAGTATIPSGLLPSSGTGKLGVHRLRIENFQREGLTQAELRFDFEIEASVAFGE